MGRWLCGTVEREGNDDVGCLSLSSAAAALAIEGWILYSIVDVQRRYLVHLHHRLDIYKRLLSSLHMTSSNNDDESTTTISI
jgi:hypothetical protein